MPIILVLSAVLSLNAATAQASAPPTEGVVLHLALIKSFREHTNFEIAQARLRHANPDRRLITMVRERTFEDVNGLISDTSVADLDRDLRLRLAKLDRPIELVYVQMNDLNWMRDDGTPNLLLHLRGHLAPTARVVLIGHNPFSTDVRASASRASKFLKMLGAPEGSLIAQVTPTILPYDARDFAKSPTRRLAASAIKGFGFAAMKQGFAHLGPVDAVTYPLVAAGAAAIYHRAMLPGPRDADTELKPKYQYKSFPRIVNIDDLFFTAGIGLGTAALSHGYFHVGAHFLNGDLVTHGLAATGVFFAFSLAPKVIHNARVMYTEFTRHVNFVRLVSATEATELLLASDPANFTCARNLTGETHAPARVPQITNLNDN